DPANANKTLPNPNYQKVYNSLKEVKNVKSIKFSSKDEQMTLLTQSLGNDWNLMKGDANPLYDAYIIEANSPQDVKQVSKDAGQVAGVYKASYGGTDTERMLKIAGMIQTWGMVIAGLLLVIAIFLISNTIRITIMSRQREIQIMRLVGAKNGYIRWPFFLEGAWVGFLGAIVPSILVVWLYNLAYVSTMPALMSQDISLLPRSSFVPMIVGLLFLIGILIGSLGSILSMRRYLKA
ncbi:MAG: permease-like cell division protein FtsX, partial [Streptococcaceae bacterium]|nr:permease-like cell division protein FtsX [Streptococcaceae bacterium]